MDLEKETPKAAPTDTPSPKPYQTQPAKSFIPTQKNYAPEVCVVLGVAFILLGFVGFVVDNLFGAHLSYTHNAIHVVSGAFALWFGFDSPKNALRFSYTFGILYGLLGALGFALGQSGMPTVGSLTQDSYLWKVIPDVLELGSTDHAIHILVSAVFLLGAALNFKRLQNI